jgi:HK97 family phage major capsid protein
MNTAQGGEGFRSFAEVSRSIAGLPDLDGVERAWNTYGGGSNGGFLLGTELAQSIWDKARAVDGPLSRCLFLQTDSHTFNLPAFDESSRVAGSRFGGIRAKWQGTTDDQSMSGIASQPTGMGVNFAPRRVMIFSQPFSRDLLQDAPIVEGMLGYVANQEVQYEVVDAMINGMGDVKPYGVINAPCSIKVTRAGSNAVAQADVDAMWSRMWGFCRRNAVWMCSDDTLLSLDAVATASTGWPANVYQPQGYGGNPFPLLKGRPVLPVEQCPALGSPGDLILADWSQYALVARTTADYGESSVSLSYGLLDSFVERRSSEHLHFDTESVVFRYKLRIDGKPLWKQAVTIADGSQAASPFVVLQ